MDKIQEEFEGWLKSSGNLTMKEDNGEYSFQHTRFAFEAWKAARSTLCIKLPKGESGGQYVNIVDVEISLDDAGVRYE